MGSAGGRLLSLSLIDCRRGEQGEKRSSSVFHNRHLSFKHLFPAMPKRTSNQRRHDRSRRYKKQQQSTQRDFEAHVRASPISFGTSEVKTGKRIITSGPLFTDSEVSSYHETAVSKFDPRKVKRWVWWWIDGHTRTPPEYKRSKDSPGLVFRQIEPVKLHLFCCSDKAKLRVCGCYAGRSRPYTTAYDIADGIHVNGTRDVGPDDPHLLVRLGESCCVVSFSKDLLPIRVDTGKQRTIIEDPFFTNGYAIDTPQTLTRCFYTSAHHQVNSIRRYDIHRDHGPGFNRRSSEKVFPIAPYVAFDKRHNEVYAIGTREYHDDFVVLYTFDAESLEFKFKIELSEHHGSYQIEGVINRPQNEFYKHDTTYVFCSGFGRLSMFTLRRESPFDQPTLFGTRRGIGNASFTPWVEKPDSFTTITSCRVDQASMRVYVLDDRQNQITCIEPSCFQERTAFIASAFLCR